MPKSVGYKLTLLVNSETLEVRTYFANDGKDKFEVNGKVYEYLGGFRYAS